MAMTVTKHANGFLLGKKIYFMTEDGAQEDAKYINLAVKLGDDMHYGNHETRLIDYPGEYDIDGISIHALAGKAGEMNYLIDDGQKAYAFVQTEDALNDEDFNADFRLFTDAHIAKTLDKMEMEGEKVDLMAIGG
jgi:hypothetical protein